MATIAEHIAAASNDHLLSRIIGAAQIERIPQPNAWATENVAEIVSTEITVFGQTTNLANLYAFAVASFVPGKDPEPGLDANKTANEAIFAAVQAVHARQTA